MRQVARADAAAHAQHIRAPARRGGRTRGRRRRRAGSGGGGRRRGAVHDGEAGRKRAARGRHDTRVGHSTRKASAERYQASDCPWKTTFPPWSTNRARAHGPMLPNQPRPMLRCHVAPHQEPCTHSCAPPSPTFGARGCSTTRSDSRSTA